MVYRKGELTRAAIDRDWPHQVALTAEYVQGRNYTILDRFCHRLSLCPRRQTYPRDGREYIVYCFAEKGDAELFAMHFDGELMTPETRPPKYPKVRR